jgi:hypothetical protein
MLEKQSEVTQADALLVNQKEFKIQSLELRCEKLNTKDHMSETVEIADEFQELIDR